MKVQMQYDSETGSYIYREHTIEVETGIGYESDYQYIHTLYTVYAVDGSLLHASESMREAIQFIDDSVYVS